MNPPKSANPGGITRYDALAIEDAAPVQRVSLGPGSLLVRMRPGRAEVLVAGPPGEVDRHPAAGGAERVALPDSVIVPALVNAHTHLDLTHIGPQPLDTGAGFLGFVERVRGGRATERGAIAASVREGVRLCLAGGTAAVGDIAGAVAGHASLAPFRELVRSALMGVSFVEFFGIGRGREERLERAGGALDSAPPSNDRPIRLGLQPHAPYSVSLESYRWAIGKARRLGLPLCTHLAENAEEAQFIAQASGPIRALLERIGVWDESVRSEIGQGRRPVEHLAGVLGGAPFLAVHVNLASDADIGTLAATGTSVAYCPRASAYFGTERQFGPHRYRDMLGAGVNVCLGTDSIINLPGEAADPGTGGMSVLDEMRFLFQRDGTDPGALLGMGTVNGARALGLDAAAFTLAPGSMVAGLLAVDVGATAGDRPALERVMRSSGRVRWVVGAGTRSHRATRA